jgi:hypothetical protein
MAELPKDAKIERSAFFFEPAAGRTVEEKGGAVI